MVSLPLKTLKKYRRILLNEDLEKEKLNAENTINQLRKENELLREKVSHLQKNVEDKGTIHGAMCDDFEGFVKTMADREKRGKRY